MEDLGPLLDGVCLWYPQADDLLPTIPTPASSPLRPGRGCRHQPKGLEMMEPMGRDGRRMPEESQGRRGVGDGRMSQEEGGERWTFPRESLVWAHAPLRWAHQRHGVGGKVGMDFTAGILQAMGLGAVLLPQRQGQRSAPSVAWWLLGGMEGDVGGWRCGRGQGEGDGRYQRKCKEDKGGSRGGNLKKAGKRSAGQGPGGPALPFSWLTFHAVLF